MHDCCAHEAFRIGKRIDVWQLTHEAIDVSYMAKREADDGADGSDGSGNPDRFEASIEITPPTRLREHAKGERGQAHEQTHPPSRQRTNNARPYAILQNRINCELCEFDVVKIARPNAKADLIVQNTKDRSGEHGAKTQAYENREPSHVWRPPS